MKKFYDVTSYLQKLYVLKNMILPELFSKTKTYSYKYSIGLFAAFADGDNFFPEDWQAQNRTTLERCPHSQRLKPIQKCNMGTFLFNNIFFPILIPVFLPWKNLCMFLQDRQKAFTYREQRELVSFPLILWVD